MSNRRTFMNNNTAITLEVFDQFLGYMNGHQVYPM